MIKSGAPVISDQGCLWLAAAAFTSLYVSVMSADNALLLTLRVVGTAFTSLYVSVMSADSALLFTLRVVGTAFTSLYV
ncbi:hypothetical protein, partial [Escherichia coli]|uniref:hypothetical protein n=1 Tax=Escherichia coli TaxID=562 RepID=UPI001BC86314